MRAHVQEPFGTIVPTLRYRDVAAAIDWLCNAFGFERHMVVPGEDGAVRYAELTFGGGMIMLGPVEDSTFDQLMTQPQQTGGTETQICYLFVEDAGAHCARAKAAGAEIVLDIEEADGGRGYSCRDPEGHLWNFGTYNPWKRQAAARAAEAALADRSDRRRSGGGAARLRQAVFMSGLLVGVAASAVVVAWALGSSERIDGELESIATSGAPADATAGSEQEPLARAIKDAREQLARERSAREAAERAAREAREQLAKTGAEQAGNEARKAHEQLAGERSALEAAQRIAREAQERLSLAERAAGVVQEELAAERSARLAGQKALEELMRERDAKEAIEREKLAKERAAKEAAERAAKEAREHQQRMVRRPVLREPPPEPITPYTIWPK